jgi:hypothetical protein
MNYSWIGASLSFLLVELKLIYNHFLDNQIRPVVDLRNCYKSKVDFEKRSVLRPSKRAINSEKLIF